MDFGLHIAKGSLSHRWQYPYAAGNAGVIKAVLSPITLIKVHLEILKSNKPLHAGAAP